MPLSEEQIERRANQSESELRFTPEQRRLILDTCANGCSEQEFRSLVAIAEARGLNPLTGDCFFVKRWDSQRQREVWSVQASIDSFRAKAEDTGLYAGQDEPEFEYEADGGIRLARVKIYRKDWPRPAVGIARWAEYVQTTKDGKPSRFWQKMPHNQLAKCAEALGFRKAFPRSFAKVYTPEEMMQAESPEEMPEPVATPQLARASESNELVARLRASLEAIGDRKQLEAWVLETKDSNIPPTQMDVLRVEFARKQAALRKGAA